MRNFTQTFNSLKHRKMLILLHKLMLAALGTYSFASLKDIFSCTVDLQKPQGWNAFKLKTRSLKAIGVDRDCRFGHYSMFILFPLHFKICEMIPLSVITQTRFQKIWGCSRGFFDLIIFFQRKCRWGLICSVRHTSLCTQNSRYNFLHRNSKYNWIHNVSENW